MAEGSFGEKATALATKVANVGGTVAGAVAPWAPLVGSAYGIYKDLKTWRREDTAYRRAVHDMDKAGLNTFNSGSISPAGVSASTALQNHIALTQLKQRDRELSMQEKLNDQNVLIAKHGEKARIHGTELFDPKSHPWLAPISKFTGVVGSLLSSALKIARGN